MTNSKLKLFQNKTKIYSENEIKATKKQQNEDYKDPLNKITKRKTRIELIITLDYFTLVCPNHLRIFRVYISETSKKITYCIILIPKSPSERGSYLGKTRLSIITSIFIFDYMGVQPITTVSSKLLVYKFHSERIFTWLNQTHYMFAWKISVS